MPKRSVESPTVMPVHRSTMVVLALALALPAPVRAQDAPVVVGSKNFTESAVLGEIMAQLLRDRTSLEVEHRQGLGGTLIVFEALQEGGIDLYPEYTGTAWSAILGRDTKVTDPLRAFSVVQSELRRRYSLEWLAPFGFDNTYAIAMARDRADASGLTRLSELSGAGGALDGGFSIEFVNRPDGWEALAAFYGIDLATVRPMEHALAYDALAEGVLDLTDAYTTDGRLRRYDLALLDDDLGFFPPYDAAPLVRAETLAEHPEIGEVLGLLEYAIDNDRMIVLNDLVESEGLEPAEAARRFLVEEGLVGETAGSGVATSRTDGSFLTFFASRWRETLRLSLEHLQLTLMAVLLATLVAVPFGIWITRHPLGERLGLGAAGAIQTVPSLALLAFMIAVPGLGLSVRSAIVALFLYSILPILRNTHTGIQSVDPELLDAAKGLGLTDGEILTRVQLPIATRTILAGVRTATVISIGVATLAAFIGAGGLGEPIVTGLYLNDTRLIMAGALPAAVLALGADWLLGRLEHALTPRGLLASES